MSKADEKIKPWEKHERLEQAVLLGSPNEVSRLLKILGNVEFTARALGMACRFRGLDMVKVLVENGASFKYDYDRLKRIYRNADHNITVYSPDENYSLALAEFLNIGYLRKIYSEGKNRCDLLFLNIRLRILDYLFKNADKVDFKPDEFMFFAILADEQEMVSYLKNKGVKVSERWAKIAAEGGTSDDWYDYGIALLTIGDDRFIPVINTLREEIRQVLENNTLHFTEWFWCLHEKRFLKPEFFDFLLAGFNQRKMNKSRLMKTLIDNDNVACLEIAANNGWLKQPKKRDEIIQYATDKEKTECTAFLLDFKNRTADFKTERERAEKKAERELNAAPDSVALLKKVWNYKKGGDGGLIITGYKGFETVINVPESIGKSKVTTIGRMAFSPRAGRLDVKQSTFRKTITKIILPESVNKICESAFEDCHMLQSVNIPNGVTEIEKRCFALCAALEKINLPDGLKKIGEFAFLRCNSLELLTVPEGVLIIEQQAMAYCLQLKTLTLPKSLKEIKDVYYNILEGSSASAVVVKDSYAEDYCKRNGISFKYKEDI